MHEKNLLEDEVAFAKNPEPRCAVTILLDTSSSMNGEPINELNRGLQMFVNDLTKDVLASKRVEVAIVTFDTSVRVISDFVNPEQLVQRPLTAQGTTNMGSGIISALDMIQARKQQYKKNGIAHYRPWIFMITDGEPMDSVDLARTRIKEAESKQGVAFFAVGVENADMERLKEITVRAPVKLKGLHFGELFLWLSNSLKAVSQSKVNEQAALQPPGWVEV